MAIVESLHVTTRSAAAMPPPFPERPFGVVDATTYALEGMYMPNPGEFEAPKLTYDDSNAVRATDQDDCDDDCATSNPRLTRTVSRRTSERRRS